MTTETNIEPDRTITLADTVREAVHTAEVAIVKAMTAADTPQKAVELALFVQAIAARCRDWKPMVEAHACDMLGNNDVEINGQRFYAGTVKTYKARDQRRLIEKAIELVDGDLDKLAGLLSSGAVKHGAYRSALAEAGRETEFNDDFECTEAVDFKSGKAKKQLVKAYDE